MLKNKVYEIVRIKGIWPETKCGKDKGTETARLTGSLPLVFF